MKILPSFCYYIIGGYNGGVRFGNMINIIKASKLRGINLFKFIL